MNGSKWLLFLFGFCLMFLMTSCGLPQEANDAIDYYVRGASYTVISSQKADSRRNVDEAWCVAVEYDYGEGPRIVNLFLFRTGRAWEAERGFEDGFLKANCTNYDARGSGW